jgi:hypothetical protein
MVRTDSRTLKDVVRWSVRMQTSVVSLGRGQSRLIGFDTAARLRLTIGGGIRRARVDFGRAASASPRVWAVRRVKTSEVA